jgi:6-phosphogluconate dehydrogenase
VGTSGGVWGLERGYCMMIGGETEVVQRLDPIFATLAPGMGDIPRTPGREKLGGTAEQGYLHCGPNGAGHFVKMVHNGIEYGIMAAYAEGLGVLKSANIGKQKAKPTPKRRPCATRDVINTTSTWPMCRSMAARQCHRLVVAGS